MKIAVVGCGAVGSYYGAQLSRAGHDVHFLLRSDFDVVRRNGVQIRSPQGDFRARPRCARSPHEIGQSDVVLVALKTVANDQLGKLLPPLVTPGTAVVTMQNGLGSEEQLARVIPAEQVLGGLCFVCLNRVEPGLVVHLDHGKVVLGEFKRYPEPRTHDIASAIRASGVPCDVTADLARSRWEKLVWNIPFNGLGVGASIGYEAFTGGVAVAVAGNELLRKRCFSTDQLLMDASWEALVRDLMREVIAIARALGKALPDTLVDKQVERTRSMGAYKASTLIDFERGLPLELESLFLEPLRQARGAGVATPILERLCSVLTVLDPSRQ